MTRRTIVDYGYVFDIKRFSIHDGPGIRTTIFLKGCPLVCSWCHNPESQDPGPDLLIQKERCLKCGRCIDVCPNQAVSVEEDGSSTNWTLCLRCGTCADHCPANARERVGRKVSVPELMETIRRDRIFYDESSGGVTFSGGEPLLQIDFLYRLLKECAREEIHRVVDTSGFVDQSQLSQIAGETNLFLYDLKLMDPDFHKMHTGADNRLILDNLRWLCQNGFQVTVRIPVIPGINDHESNLEELAKFLLSLPNTPPVYLLLFHSLAKNKHARFGLPYRLDPDLKGDPQKLELIAQRLIGYGLNVSAGEYDEPENSASQKTELRGQTGD